MEGFSRDVINVLCNAVGHVGVQGCGVSVQEWCLFVLCMAVEEEEKRNRVFRISAVIKHQDKQTLYNSLLLVTKNGQES